MRRVLLVLPLLIACDPAPPRPPAVPTGATGFVGTGSLPTLTDDAGDSSAKKHEVIVSAGSMGSCAIDRDQRVVCWGSNAWGGLGTGLSKDKRAPFFVGTPKAIAVDGRGSHVCAVSVSGHVDCWGANLTGAAGQANAHVVTTPSRVPMLSDIVDISASADRTCAIDRSRQLWCWGETDLPTLGAKKTKARPTPEKVPGLSRVRSVAAGWLHHCAIDTGGRAWCWGRNSAGQLGTGRTSDLEPLPTEVTVLGEITQISAGGNHTCALDNAKSVFCWGDNNQSELGIEGGDSVSAVKVPGMDNVESVASGQTFNCALRAGEVFCWGSNQYGQLAQKRLRPHARPAKVQGLPPIASISAGHGGHACATSREGDIFCWGRADSAQLGVGADTDIARTPMMVRGVSDVDMIDTAYTTNCASIDGRIHCWNNDDNEPRLMRIPGMNGVKSFAMGLDHGCALMADASVKCWGARFAVGPRPQGRGFKVRARTVDGLSDIVQLAARGSRNCAVNQSGEVWCWGGAVPGGGSGTVVAFPPTKVPGIRAAKRIQMNGTTGCAIVGAQGGVKCWQLGDGQDNPAARTISGVGSVIDLALDREHCALDRGGQVLCWNKRNPTPKAQPIGEKEKIVDIASGIDHLCALEQGGDVLCLGRNNKGQRGDGQEGSGAGSGYARNLNNVKAIAAQGHHTCAKLARGEVACWGWPDPAAIGPPMVVTEPVKVVMPRR